MPKKGSKNFLFFVLNKYQSVTHVSRCIFQGLFKNIVFRSVAFVTKKLWAILDVFLTQTLFYFLLVYPMHIKNFKLLFL